MAQRNHVAPLEDDSPEDLKYGSWKVTKGDSEKTLQKKSQVVIKEKKERSGQFDAFYKQLGSQCQKEEKRIDFVLVYPHENIKDIEDEEDKVTFERKNGLREKYEAGMKEETLQIQKVRIEDKIYTKIHCPFKRLCEEAELVKLEMPMNGCESEHKDEPNFFNNWVKKTFVTDNEVDLVSAPFMMERMHVYMNFDDPTNFFRPSLRSLLVEHILINIDLRKQGVKHEGKFKHAQEAKSLINCWGCIKQDAELGDMQKVGLDYMVLEEVYTNKFILHEESLYDPDEPSEKNDSLPKDEGTLKYDPRFDMQLTWTKIFKFQPLWKIRNYFGEKIAFYFAWSGTLISTLWLPMLFGFAVFIYGLVKSIQKTYEPTDNSSNNSSLTDLFRNVKESFDNDVTPYFAMFISIWGTLFLEIWKRKQSELAYQWDVEQFEENEPDRPEFYGTKHRTDPVTNEQDWYYPFTRKAWKLFLSSMTLLFMMCIVIVSVLAVIVYRVFATVDYCPDLPDGECLFVSTVMSSVLNAISILILGRLYDWVAKKLTDWENHRTQTQYNDALIIKLFAFQFVNNYASCFYIAFFRGRFDSVGILGRGSKYQDSCEGTCMSQLSFQVLVLMITKPLPKLATDVILPWVLKQFKSRCQCCACIPFLKNFFKEGKPKSEKTLLEIEVEKPSLGNFTMSEYTEKIIQYGLMMLFAAAFPLAPLLALLTNAFDLRIDAWRMLWWYQRPRAEISEDIGTWFVILQTLNYAGVVSNAFLIAFTSSWGSYYSLSGKLWIVIGFEHIVFLLKFLIAYLIPDTPSSVALAIRKKRYQLFKKIQEEQVNGKGTVVVTTTTYEKKDEDGVPRSRRNFVGGDETEIRRLKKKRKNRDDVEDGHQSKRDISPPDYSRRITTNQMNSPTVGYLPETYNHM